MVEKEDSRKKGESWGAGFEEKVLGRKDRQKISRGRSTILRFIIHVGRGRRGDLREKGGTKSIRG